MSYHYRAVTVWGIHLTKNEFLKEFKDKDIDQLTSDTGVEYRCMDSTEHIFGYVVAELPQSAAGRVSAFRDINKGDERYDRLWRFCYYNGLIEKFDERAFFTVLEYRQY